MPALPGGSGRQQTAGFLRLWEEGSTPQTEAGEALRQMGKAEEWGAEIETFTTRNKDRPPWSLLCAPHFQRGKIAGRWDGHAAGWPHSTVPTGSDPGPAIPGHMDPLMHVSRSAEGQCRQPQKPMGRHGQAGWGEVSVTSALVTGQQTLSLVKVGWVRRASSPGLGRRSGFNLGDTTSLL